MKRTTLLLFFLCAATVVSAYFIFKNYWQQDSIAGIGIPVLATPASAGFIPADLNVGESGNPNFNMPIDVPVGTNHVQPNLSLTYSGVSNNGILGTGWNLTGLAVISRTGKIIPQDQIKGGVSLTANDRFAINGQRLVAYRDKAGRLLTTVADRDAAYGQDGTEYRTEVETWIKVYSRGNCGGSPCSFTAFTKDGSRMDFAGTPDSKIQPAGSPVIMIWGVNKVTDRNGNYVSVNYTQDSGSGSWLPSQIMYTGNERGNLAPQRMVEFITESRKDTLVNYIAGIRTSCTRRIKNINTYVDLDGDGNKVNDKKNLVKTYSVAYSYSASTGRSLIDSISVHDNNGNVLPGTDFSWTKINRADYFADTLTPLPNAFSKILSTEVKKVKADFNGDGRVDIALFQSKASTIPVIFTNAGFNFSMTQKQVPAGFSIYLNEVDIQPLTGDFNGDGLTDIAFFKNQSPRVPVLFSRGDGSFRGKVFPLTSDFSAVFSPSSVTKYMGDFNGDGLADVAGFMNGYKSVPLLLMRPDGGFDCKLAPIPSEVSAYVNSPGAMQILCDINGDALTDVVCFNQGYQSVPILLSLGNGNFSASLKQLPEEVRQYVNTPGVKRIQGDYNGDGLADISIFKTGYTAIPVIYSKGDGSFSGKRIPLSPEASALFNGKDSQIVTGDLNGDGITDLTAFNEDARSVPVLFSNAGAYAYSFIKLEDKVADYINARGVERFVSDFNADGLIDIAALKKGYTALPVLISNKLGTENNLPDLMVKTTDGIGGFTQINYQPYSAIADATPDTTQRYPLMSVKFPRFVVTQTTRSGSKTSTVIQHLYAYESPVVDHYRGWMGFQKTIMTDLQTKTRNVSRHKVEFPFMGVVESQVIADASSPARLFGKVQYFYQSKRDSLTAVTRLWNKSHEIIHYTQGNYNYTRKKNFIYDKDHRLITRVHDLGDIAVPDDEFFIAFLYDSYDQNKEDWWKSFYPVSERTYKDSTDHNRWQNWTASDLAWKKYSYDRSMNMKVQSAYADHNGEKKINSWISSSVAYDVFGNPVAHHFPPNYSSDSIVYTTAYDNIFHTFPATVTTPVPLPGSPGSKSLKTQYAYDPRFDQKVLEIDANGNTHYLVPDNGIDGFGRIIEVQGTKPFSDDLVVQAVSNVHYDKEAGYSITESFPVQWTTKAAPDSTWLWQRQVHDGLGREVRSERNGYNSRTSLVTLTGFNSKGELEKQFMPFFYSPAQGIHYGQDGSSLSDSTFVLQKYDEHGRLKSLWAPATETGEPGYLSKEFIYDPLDDRTIYTREPSPSNDAVFIRWKKVYDSHGKLIGKSGPYNDDGSQGSNFSSVSYQHDCLGRLVRVTDPLNETIAYRYNSLGHLIHEHRPETDTVKYVFNANEWIVSKVHANGRINVSYDDLGRVSRKISISAALSQKDITVFLYDNDSISDNGKGKLSKVILPYGYYSYRYDKTGAVSQKSVFFKELGKTFAQTFFYDGAQRLISSVYPDSSIANYTYNHGGNLSSVSLNNDTLATFRKYNALDYHEEVNYLNAVNSKLDYDNLGRPIYSETYKGDYTHRKFDYAWTKSNKLKSITDQRAHKDVDLSQNFSYYTSGRLYTATGAYGTESYVYDATGNRVADDQSRYEYDPLKKHELITIDRKNTGSYDLAYDAVGNLTQTVWKAGRPARPDSQVQASASDRKVQYAFDVEGNLRQVTRTVDGSTTKLNEFSYDDDGNRSIKRDSGNVVTYYISPTYEVVKLSPKKSLHTRYVSDHRNVIFSSTASGDNVKLMANNTALTMHYGDTSTLSDLLIYLKSPQILPNFFIALSFMLIVIWCISKSLLRQRTKNKNGLLQQSRNTPEPVDSMMFSSSAAWKRWAYGAMLWASVILASPPVYADTPPGSNGEGIPEAGEVRFYHHDHLGSSVMLTDMTGGLTNAIVYEPYGTIDKKNSTGKDNFRAKFTGKEIDAATNLYYFGSRYYDSETGRFISTDPAQQYFSPYIYGDADPMSGTDPNGEAFFAIALIVAAIVGAYVGASLANQSFNPAHWDWASAKTWIGLVSGAAAGIAVVATGGGALAYFGAVSKESVTLFSISASALAFASADVAFAVSDAYSFSKDQSVSNGIFLGLDVVPFAGALLGRVSRPARTARAESAAAHEADEVAHMEESSSFEGCVMSFTAGTEIKTVDGTKPIEQISVGDEVVGYDIDRNETRSYPVSRIFSRVAAGLVLLITSSCDTIAVTPEHPFYVPGKGWIEAQSLKSNDPLLSVNSVQPAYASSANTPATPYEYVKQVKYIADTVVRVFNFEVEGVHNYFASGSSVLVHNGCDKTRAQRRAAAKQYGPKSRFGRPLRKVNPGNDPDVPGVLLVGPRDHDVYIGYQRGKPTYVGITKQSLASRQAQHGPRFTLQKITAYKLTKPQARSLEQYFINQHPSFQNMANSVSKKNGWYRIGQRWAREFVKAKNIKP